jgi:hypothetical protein
MLGSKVLDFSTTLNKITSAENLKNYLATFKSEIEKLTKQQLTDEEAYVLMKRINPSKSNLIDELEQKTLNPKLSTDLVKTFERSAGTTQDELNLINGILDIISTGNSEQAVKIREFLNKKVDRKISGSNTASDGRELIIEMSRKKLSEFEGKSQKEFEEWAKAELGPMLDMPANQFTFYWKKLNEICVKKDSSGSIINQKFLEKEPHCIIIHMLRVAWVLKIVLVATVGVGGVLGVGKILGFIFPSFDAELKAMAPSIFGTPDYCLSSDEVSKIINKDPSIKVELLPKDFEFIEDVTFKITAADDTSCGTEQLLILVQPKNPGAVTIIPKMVQKEKTGEDTFKYILKNKPSDVDVGNALDAAKAYIETKNKEAQEKLKQEKLNDVTGQSIIQNLQNTTQQSTNKVAGGLGKGSGPE